MDFKVGDRVNLLPGTKSYMGHPLPSCGEYTLYSKHEYPGIWNVGREALYEGPSWMVADVSMVPIPQPVSNAALDVANTLLAASHKAIDELRGDLDRANTLVGALEKLLSSERDVSRADRLLHTYKSNLHQAEAEYRKARDSFDRASSESDTNGGESS